MVFISVFIVSTILKSGFPDLVGHLNFAAQKLHNLCVQQNPSQQIQLEEIYSAFVCGASLNDAHLNQIFKNSGLLHLIVVSGAHFLFLEGLLKKIFSPLKKSKAWIIPSLLCIYAFMTQLSPPVLKAVFSIAFRFLNQRARLLLSEDHILLCTALFLMGWQPWISQSWSFLLSWAASLSLILFQNYQSQILWHQTLVFCYLFPVLFRFQVPTPLFILFNAFIGPIFGLTLFPLALSAFVIPPLHWLTDPCFQTVLQVLESLTMTIGTSPPAELAKVSPTFVLSYLFLTHWILLWLNLFKPSSLHAHSP